MEWWVVDSVVQWSGVDEWSEGEWSGVGSRIS